MPRSIELYFWPTPNGKKITILLEEAELPYNVAPVDIAAGEQFDRKSSGSVLTTRCPLS